MTVTADSPTFPRVGMEWGIKRSFIRYVAYLPDGNHVTEDGAYLNDSSIFTFPNFVVAEPDIGAIRFQGTVKVGGHGGLLGVLLSDPWVHLSGNEGVLSVIDPEEWPSRSHRIILADLEVELQGVGDGSRLHCLATLAESGVALFDGHYPCGTALDPVVIH
ncbi:HtaA domain-containing protein [Rhodococcus globerulus]|uniref:HtaA domain-containing protein n=1 Tax=Rhodococcus globerulus TaxID=33008 RepID=UPI002165711B|nr:HtaA domain-containing protein [Rhodococcus globerulus]